MSNTAGITADVLNKHFAQISTDPSYTVPVAKLTTAPENQDYTFRSGLYLKHWTRFTQLQLG